MSQNDVSDVVVDPTTDAEVVDTQPNIAETSPDSDAVGHEEGGESSQSAPEDNPIQEEGKPDSVKTEEAARREEGKLQQTQRELNQLREQFQRVSGWIAADPDRYEQALVNTSGYTPKQARELADQLRARQAQVNQVQEPQANVTQPNQPLPDPYQAAAMVYEQKRREEEYQRTASQTLNNLKQSFPELAVDPTTLSQEERDTHKSNLSRAEKLAYAKMEVLPSLNYEDAVKSAYSEITGKTAQQVQQAREDGRLEGLATSTVAQSAKSSPSVTQPTKGSNYNLSDADRQMAEKFGMTEEDWVKYGEADSGSVK